MNEEEHQVTEHGEDAPSPRTSEQVTQGIVDLLKEVDAAFDSDRWAILDTSRDHATWLLYDGAALRHRCRLLYEIEVAAADGLEFVVRNLGRAHIEAWLVALYVHFGGYGALVRVAQDARHGLEGIDLEGKQFDEWLAAEKKAVRRSSKKVAKANGGIAQWNEVHPDELAKALHDEPYVPQLSPTGLDLAGLIAGFGEHEAQGSLSQRSSIRSPSGDRRRASVARVFGRYTSSTERYPPSGRTPQCIFSIPTLSLAVSCVSRRFLSTDRSSMRFARPRCMAQPSS